jgi:hypothetical protein
MNRPIYNPILLPELREMLAEGDKEGLKTVLEELHPATIADFYISLLRSEARHYQDYLALAQQIAGDDISERIRFFGTVEAELILTADTDFKFHSGAPVRNDTFALLSTTG